MNKQQIGCIKKFFFDKAPELQKISENLVFKQCLGGDLNSLGVEGALEVCIELFEEGRLVLVGEDLNEFLVYMTIGDQLTIIYDTKEYEEDDEDIE